MMDYEELTCPFCKENDFDAIGLKRHLLQYCEAYFSTPLNFPSAPKDVPDTHSSDCATHNEPAYPNGVCDCRLVPNFELRGCEAVPLE